MLLGLFDQQEKLVLDEQENFDRSFQTYLFNKNRNNIKPNNSGSKPNKQALCLTNNENEEKIFKHLDTRCKI